ncbi:MAG: hypothetical protein HC897_07885 [Thermoanaerobaculia bacterium]|nr:hypothetical protein [Thermoanaerobaculia bacterium]
MGADEVAKAVAIAAIDDVADDLLRPHQAQPVDAVGDPQAQLLGRLRTSVGGGEGGVAIDMID